MKKIVLTAVMALSVAIFAVPSALAAATTDAQAAATSTAVNKIGVINLQEMLQKIPQMKQITDDMKKKFGDRQSKIVAAQTSLKKDADEFRKNLAVMSASDKQAAEQKLFKNEQELQQMQTSFQKDYMAEQNKQVNSLMEQIKAVVDRVAAREKFDLILVNASVAFFDKKLDVTNLVMNELLKK